MKLSLKRVVVASLATIAIAGPVALAGTGALAASSRDCKLYNHCDYNAQAYLGSYDSSQPAPRAGTRGATRAPAFEIHEEGGLVAPHGVGW